MSDTVYHLQSTTIQRDITEIANYLQNKFKGELVNQTTRKSNDSTVIMMNFEKYYIRASSYAALSILLTQCDNQQSVDIVGFGGGQGWLNISYGANSDYAWLAKEELVKIGFKVQK